MKRIGSLERTALKDCSHRVLQKVCFLNCSYLQLWCCVVLILLFGESLWIIPQHRSFYCSLLVLSA
uniref:Uncharacterized protein n=1 Tax=Anguilla anguilla TaxID=7936 RepID=A0A0E9WAK6_ANGAN